MIASFFFIDRGPTTTAFMNDVGVQLAAAIYSITVFTYCGVVLAAMLALSRREFRVATRIMRIPAALLTLGSLSGFALSVAVLVMDIAHVSGAVDLLHHIQWVYGPLTLVTFLLLCAGFIAQPATRLLRKRLRAVQTDVLLVRLEPLWRRAIQLRPGLSQHHVTIGLSEEPEAVLHRRIVEIRDAMIDPRITFVPNNDQLDLLEHAEQHLLGARRSMAKHDKEAA